MTVSPSSGAPRPAAWLVRRWQVSWLVTLAACALLLSVLSSRALRLSDPPEGWTDRQRVADSCGGSRRLAPGIDPARAHGIPFSPARAGPSTHKHKLMR